MRARRRVRLSLFRDESGVTTVGMAVALLVTLSLVFSSAQVYRINTASAEIQEVADAAVLTAENEVAEFMVAVRVCDAAVLSMTMLSASACGLGAVALCVPAGASIGGQLVELGEKMAEARDSFARKAEAGLNALQRALPFLAAANAASVAAANNPRGAVAGYFAAAVLVPFEGKPISIADAQAVSDAGKAVSDSAEDIRAAVGRAEQAAEQANEAKLRAFERDCGASPAYCMYERADHLASLPADENPLYRSVDAWSFSVALRRAQAYYPARLAAEHPASSSVAEQANSELRKRFYAYASEQLSTGYVVETPDAFEARFPRLFRSTEELRSTPLYDEAVYPVTDRDGVLTMHAWPGCPNAAGAVSAGSIRSLEEGGYQTCELCAFTPSSLGNVAAASTAIDNGFEYHYEAVARAAEDYARAREELAPKAEEVKGRAGGLIDACAQAMADLGPQRIAASPPGAKGAIALVVNVDASAADAGFESAFVSGGRTLGTRAAVSGATLLADAGHDGSTVITSLLDGFGQGGGAAVGAARVVLDCWSGLLSAFAQGQEALSGAIEGALGSLPLASASGLGAWASGKLRDAVAACGLEPVKLDALKPVLVNTGRVAEAGDDAFSVRFREAKRRALATSSGSGSLFAGLVDDVEDGALGLLDDAEGGVTVASVELPVGGVRIPVKLALPSFAADEARGFVAVCAQKVRSAVGAAAGARAWE
ncbi:TadE/TadG family type IV pilus assembly protein [Adlercreutzia sp. ZJ473]|uniref:TadE/TadG family type IV pilus assembly protein n=1 Tax=Adlercreutzia sp. ZJ473 TaxID=2722822 RepID=UPI0015552ADE|nr:molybdenum cofactor biosynthesis enzyme [Adlercreutzia sp. ZJ473]